MGTTTYGIKVTAPFLVNHRWRWDSFKYAGGNSHAAIIQHGRKIGAQAWDFGQATVSDVCKLRTEDCEPA